MQGTTGGNKDPSDTKKALNFQFEPVTLAFKDLKYFVPNPDGTSSELELLKGVSGVFRPGVLTALMGASGAGKTTLMDVLAGTAFAPFLRTQMHRFLVFDGTFRIIFNTCLLRIF